MPEKIGPPPLSGGGGEGAGQRARRDDLACREPRAGFTVAQQLDYAAMVAGDELREHAPRRDPVEQRINSRPRKRLAWRSPSQVMKLEMAG